MGFTCGIVGLPNIGKSTLFNALTATIAAQAANFPFCTIEPNLGRVAVPDPRLDAIANLCNPAKIIPTQLEFSDIAGLVRGSAKGEGLGNQFLGNIREVDAIIHVIRCFENDEIIHVEGKIDPERDRSLVETELMLSDLDSLERRKNGLIKRATGGDRDARILLEVMERALSVLREGEPARKARIPAEQKAIFKQLNLLTAKPVLYVCNVEEAAAATGNALSDAINLIADKEQAACVVISAAIEAEVAQLETFSERSAFLADLGLESTGLSRVIQMGYRLLDLLTFFTAGPKEARAWTIQKGSLAPEAAGTIHSDFERGFICAETISYTDYIALGGEQAAREAGRLRLEGKAYPVCDGDIFHFRFNV